MRNKSRKRAGAGTIRDDDNVTELRYLLLAAQREGSRMLSQALSPVGLTPSQAEILGVLADHDQITLGELGRLIVCESGSPSRIIDTLVVRGLVDRQPGADDRRKVELSLTPLGAELVPHVREAEAAMNTVLGFRLTDDDIEQVADVIRRLLSGTASGEALSRRFAVG